MTLAQHRLWGSTATTSQISCLSKFTPLHPGDAVGSDVVGDTDGDIVGSEVVGEIDGDTVGSEVVGDVDGDVVGSEVVGDTDGETVGSEVVGDTEGDTVGEMVGSDVMGDTDMRHPLLISAPRSTQSHYSPSSFAVCPFVCLRSASDAAYTQIDLLEHPKVTNIVLLTTVLDEVKHRSAALYTRAREMVKIGRASCRERV